jgi:hypothetical protein
VLYVHCTKRKLEPTTSCSNSGPLSRSSMAV